LGSRLLCVADFTVGPIMSLGRSPFREQRVGYITGGSFRGDRLSGEILPGGGNWPMNGPTPDGGSFGTFDARCVWQTADGAVISITYTGRSRVPVDVARRFRDPDASPVDPADYYLRIAPVFETADERYGWLNGILAIGCGERMPWGVRHTLFEIL
jgi:hypothetical protein